MVDGPRLVADCVRSGLEIREVFAAEGALAGLGIDKLLGPEVDIFDVDPSLLSSILDPVNPQPMAAVAAMPTWSLDDLMADDRPFLVAVELRDPGNLGTVIRTAEAAGLAGVVVAGDSVDRFAPKVVRASAGSLFRLPTVDGGDPQALVAELRARGRSVVAAVVAPGAPPYDHTDLSRAAILIGNEPHGLPAEVVAAVEFPVTIPMAPGVESLNVGAAAAVLCFEAARQRRAGTDGGRNPMDSHRSSPQGVHNEPASIDPAGSIDAPGPTATIGAPNPSPSE